MNKTYFFLLLILNFNLFAQNNIFDACRNGDLTTLKKIYNDNPESINTENKDGYLPLTLACYYGHLEVVDFLAEKVKNINGTSKFGTPLMAAVVKGYAKITEKLLLHKANPNSKDANNTTALHYAIMFKKKDLVKLLLEAGADLSLKDNNGNSPEDYAKMVNNTDINKLIKKK